MCVCSMDMYLCEYSCLCWRKHDEEIRDLCIDVEYIYKNRDYNINKREAHNI